MKAPIAPILSANLRISDSYTAPTPAQFFNEYFGCASLQSAQHRAEINNDPTALKLFTDALDLVGRIGLPDPYSRR